MKSAIVAWCWVVISLFIAAEVYAADGPMKQKVDGYTVTIAFEKIPPQVGDNALRIIVTDPAGKEWTNPVIKLRVYMQEEKIAQKVQKMAYMVAPVDQKHKCASCTATVDFTMQGPWIIDVAAAKGNKHLSASFNVDVR